MAEHPPVTVTQTQYDQLAPFFPYTITPELNAQLMTFAAGLLETALALVLLAPTPQQAQALESLENASAWTQQAMVRGMGIPHPPSWLHVQPPDERPPQSPAPGSSPELALDTIQGQALEPHPGAPQPQQEESQGQEPTP